MEGSRHERAALVGLAYFIGGLTAFIWYAHGLTTEISVPDISTQPASLIQANPTTDTPQTSTVSYHDGMLEVDAFGNKKILSFNPEITGAKVTDDFSNQGIHIGDLSYIASPSEEYVFFCEKKEVTASTCSPFVYDVVADTIYPLRRNGDRVELLTSAAADASWNQNSLQIDTEVAKDSSKPWLLGY